MFRHRFLIAAVLLALLATKLTNTYIRRLEAQALGEGTRVQVVVAKNTIPQGTCLKPNHVTLRWWPADLVPPGAFSDPSQVENQIAAVDFVPGEPIIAGRLVEEEEQSLAWRLSPGERAVAVPVRGVEGLERELTHGRRVDLLGTFLDYGTGLENSVVVLENVKLLDATSTENAYGSSFGSQTVVLAVTPEEAQKLALFSSSGQLHLLLRPEAEEKSIGSKGGVLTVRDLFGLPAEGRKENAGSWPVDGRGQGLEDQDSTRTVEIIRGTSSTVEIPASAAFTR